MQQTSKSRAFLMLKILCLYLLPILALTGYSMGITTKMVSWNLFSFGLLISFLGSGVLFLSMYQWESNLRQELESAIPVPEEAVSSNEMFSPKPEQHSPTQFELSEEYKNAQNLLLQETIAEWQNKNSHILDELSQKEHEIEKLIHEKVLLQDQIAANRREFDTYRESSKLQFAQQQQLIAEYQNSVSELRSQAEKQQHQIAVLENKERDLCYELKTLVALSNYDTPLYAEPPTVKSTTEYPQMQPQQTMSLPLNLETAFQGNKVMQDFKSESLVMVGDHSQMVKTPTITSDYGLKDCVNLSPSTAVSRLNKPSKVIPISTKLPSETASQHLNHLLDISIKMTGAHQLPGVPSHLRDLPIDSYSSEFNQLCNSLNMDTDCIVILYSSKESLPKFVNDQVTAILGWTPQRFIQDFSEILQDDADIWKHSSSASQEVKTTLTAKTAEGSYLSLHCHLKVIPSGTFRQHILGVLYPDHLKPRNGS